MTPFEQIRSPLVDLEAMRIKVAITTTETLFQENRDRGFRFEMHWSPGERRTYVRHPDARRVHTSIPDDAMMVGVYNGESGLVQFKEDLRATLAECGL